MRKWLLALLCCLLMLSAALAEKTVPEAILTDTEAWYPGAVIEDYAVLSDVDGAPMAFLLIRHADVGRQLRIYTPDEAGTWQPWNSFSAAIPQIDLPYVWLSVEEAGTGSYEAAGSLWYDENPFDYTYPSGPKVGVWTSDGTSHEERVVFVWQGDNFYLHHYGDNPSSMIDLAEEDMIFYNIGYGYEGRARCPFSRHIYDIDFYALPRRLSDVRIMGEEEPTLPENIRPEVMDEQEFLVPQDVKLKEGKYAVYMGPGKSFGRAAGGKAAVSTNGWVQVFGEYNGYLLIQYAISAEQYRFGWITDAALAKGEKAAALPLVFGDYVTLEIDLALTDDPLNSREPLAVIPVRTHADELSSIEYLAQLGEGYSLVRVVADGKTWWGFVPTWPLGHG